MCLLASIFTFLILVFTDWKKIVWKQKLHMYDRWLAVIKHARQRKAKKEMKYYSVESWEM